MKYVKYAFLFLMASSAALFIFFFQIGLGGVKVREAHKPLLKEIVHHISGFVYDEATKHNPPGDMLPDGIDDTIKGEIKDAVR